MNYSCAEKLNSTLERTDGLDEIVVLFGDATVEDDAVLSFGGVGSERGEVVHNIKTFSSTWISSRSHISAVDRSSGSFSFELSNNTFFKTLACMRQAM